MNRSIFQTWKPNNSLEVKIVYRYNYVNTLYFLYFNIPYLGVVALAFFMVSLLRFIIACLLVRLGKTFNVSSFKYDLTFTKSENLNQTFFYIITYMVKLNSLFIVTGFNITKSRNLFEIKTQITHINQNLKHK